MVAFNEVGIAFIEVRIAFGTLNLQGFFIVSSFGDLVWIAPALAADFYVF